MNKTGSPIIGITAPYNPSETNSGAFIQGQLTSYIKAVAGVGGAPVLIPMDLDDKALKSILDHLDGLVLPGGVDVSPAAFNEPPHEKIGRVDEALDRTELRLAVWAVDKDMPLIAICRGIQLFNVALGGTLYQDIEAQLPGALEHHRFTTRGYPRDDRAHEVEIEPESQLAKVLGSTRVTTNSRHHQAIKRPADKLTVNAHTSDGVIEGVEIPGARFAFGVQWHPENLVDSDIHMRRLFEGLVKAARQCP